MRIKPRDIIPLLFRDGWRLVSIRGGSHAKFMKDGKHTKKSLAKAVISFPMPPYTKSWKTLHRRTGRAVLTVFECFLFLAALVALYGLATFLYAK